jgi:hypothetical protein
MVADAVKRILDEVQGWPTEQQIELARAIDRLTWRLRWQAIEDEAKRQAREHPITENEIEEAVLEVRRDRPLPRRS